MQKFIKYGFILSAVILGLYACQKGIEKAAIEDSKYKEYKTWLNTSNNNIFSKEEITLNLKTGNNITGKLNWNQARQEKNKKGDEVLAVPFNFEESVYKSKKIHYDLDAGELPSIYSIIIKKNKDGLFEGRLRISSYQKDELKGSRIFNTLYNLNGDYSIAYFTDANGKNYLLHDELSAQNTRTSVTCELIATSIVRYVECTGPEMDLICTCKSRTIRRYHCTLSEQEMEEIDYIQPEEYAYEYEESETIYENQRIIDSLQGYPCAQGILQQMPNLNSFTDSLLNNIFGVSDHVDILFKPGNGMPIQTNAVTVPPTGLINNKYNITIYLNPWMLQNSSKDLIVKTMIHESIHAMVDYDYAKYLDGTLDSNTFKNLYPLVWEYKSGNFSHAQHIEMSERYVSAISSVLAAFNSGLAGWQTNALSWGGLHATPAYISLSTEKKDSISSFNELAKYGTALEFDNNGLKKCN